MQMNRCVRLEDDETDLSRGDVERRVWRETEANHFASFYGWLLQAADTAPHT
jgi:hypothetical protein